MSAGAYIADANANSDEDEDDNYASEFFNMFEVFTTKKSDPAPPKSSPPNVPSVNPVVPASTSAPIAYNARPPQYRYQASAEDQFLTKQVMDWILEGKLDQITPAHILATSPPIRKELVERLRPRRVETGSFEQVSTDSTNPVSVLELTAQREAEFSLPLREIDVLVNNLRTEAGVLDQGSQIVVIREDLAKEVGAQINTQRTLRMEGANSSTSRTLGCAEDLSMRIGDVSFSLHAHVVRTAPFRLLLGRPFHHLLLCRLEDHPDRVDVSIRDPANPSRSVAVPSRARQGAQVGFVSALTCQAHPEPPHEKILERYVIAPSPANSLLSDDKSDDAAAVPAHRNVVKAHPADSTYIFQAPEGVGPPRDVTDLLSLPQSTSKARAHNDEPPGIPDPLTCDKQHKSVATPPAWLERHFIIKHIRTPFYIAHDRLESVLLFDINLTTLLAPNSVDTPFTADLVTRAWQLQRHDDDLAAIYSSPLKSRFESVCQFERQFEKTIRDCDFGPAAFRLVPYHTRSCSSIPVTRLVDREDLARAIADEDIVRADFDDVLTEDSQIF